MELIIKLLGIAMVISGCLHLYVWFKLRNERLNDD